MLVSDVCAPITEVANNIGVGAGALMTMLSMLGSDCESFIKKASLVSCGAAYAMNVTTSRWGAPGRCTG
jgi:hypothetical protein